MPEIITLDTASKLGYGELCFTWNGLGDNLALLFAAEELYKRYGKKTLISASHNNLEIFKNSDAVDLIEGFSLIEIKRDKSLISELGKYAIKPVFIHAIVYSKSFDNPGKNRQFLGGGHFFSYYCERIGLEGELQINPKLILTQEEKTFGRFFKKNQIAIMSNGLQKYKTYPPHKTQNIIDALKDKYNFIQLGSSKDVKLNNVLDFRGKSSIRQSASILHNSDLFVGGIGGLMHLARAVSCRSVITYSLAEGKGYGSYPCNKNITVADGCNLCFYNKRYPRNLCYNNHSCIKNIPEQEVISAIDEMMSKEKYPLEVQTLEIQSDKVNGMDLYYQFNNTVSEINSTSDFFINKTQERLKRIRILQILDIDIKDIKTQKHS
ncbi:MAG: hypothetical protein LBC92_03390 [Rickettsiales bacterium]|jgi:CDP-glycerol glycerophosphotransferase|nr:hypothetical protein [Rickettsiales bacterium]